MADCIFCGITAGTTPSEKVNETPTAVVVMDVFPEAEGHCLIIPKKHYVKPSDIPADEFHSLMELVVRVQESVLKSGLGMGTNIIQNYWPYIPQGKYKIDHVHFHVIPRNPGDTLEKKPAKVEQLKQDADLLRKALEELYPQPVAPVAKPPVVAPKK